MKQICSKKRPIVVLDTTKRAQSDLCCTGISHRVALASEPTHTLCFHIRKHIIIAKWTTRSRNHVGAGWIEKLYHTGTCFLSVRCNKLWILAYCFKRETNTLHTALHVSGGGEKTCGLRRGHCMWTWSPDMMRTNSISIR